VAEGQSDTVCGQLEPSSWGVHSHRLICVAVVSCKRRLGRSSIPLFSQTVVHGDAVFYDDSITASKCIISGASIRLETRNLTYPWLALTVQFLMLVNTNCIVRSDVFTWKKNKHGRKSCASSGR